MTGDMLTTIIPRSDQTNSDDLIGGPRTIRITGVDIRAGDQPVSIQYEGGEGKPWKPCKSMRRVLVEAWGADSAAYIGRLVTLVRDPSVRFGKDEVGGIRVSHLSHIDKTMRIALTVTKGKRAPYEVQPLVVPGVAPKKKTDATDRRARAEKQTEAIIAELAATDDVMGVLAKHADAIKWLGDNAADLKTKIDDAAAKSAVGGSDV